MKIVITMMIVIVTVVTGCGTSQVDQGEHQLDQQNLDKHAKETVGEQDQDIISKRMYAPRDNKSGGAGSAKRLYNPQITRLSGKVVKRRDLMKKYEYYLVLDDGAIYALDMISPPDGGIDKMYHVIGVMMVATADYEQQLEREAKSHLLPGQSIPESPIVGTLYDVSFTLANEQISPAKRRKGDRSIIDGLGV